jgi:protein phosphatase
MITEEQARVHPMKNVVTQALGGGERLTVDINEFKLESGDIIMLCSDGLNSMVPHSVIEDVFKSDFSSLDELCDKLIKEANKAGGEDNITVVLGKY